MGNIIDISDRFNIQNKKLEIFNNVANKKGLRNEIKKYDKHYEYIITKFDEIYDKLKKGLWSNKTDNKFVEKFESITASEDETLKYINELEFIYLYDLLKEDIFKVKDEYINIFLYIPDSFLDVQKKSYEELIRCLSNKKIIEILDKKETKNEKKYEIFDYVECILDGENPIEFALLPNDEEKLDTLDSGIITIDRIYNFYSYEVMVLKSLSPNIVNDEVSNIIEMIPLIKKYNNINQNKYIELTKTIRNSAPNLIENIKNVSSLTSIFLTFDKKIDEIDLKMLEIMLFDKIINQKSIEQIKKDYERKI